MARGTYVSETSARYYDKEDSFIEMVDRCISMGITERREFGSIWPIRGDRQFETIPEVQLYVDVLKSSDWARALWPEKGSGENRVIVRPAGSEADRAQGVYPNRAYYHTNRIYIPPHGHGRSEFMREFIVLHELAHHFGPSTSHGPKFEQTMYELLAHQIDPMFAYYYRIYMTTGEDNIAAKK